MNRTFAAVIAFVLILLGLNSMFVVREGHSALVLQFGRIVQTDYQPGLHFKLPVLQQVIHFDKRILSLDAPPERYFTSEKKSVNVDFYVKWRIVDNAMYYRATGGDQLQAEQRLTPIVKDALRFEFNAGTILFIEFVWSGTDVVVELEVPSSLDVLKVSLPPTGGPPAEDAARWPWSQFGLAAAGSAAVGLATSIWRLIRK